MGASCSPDPPSLLPCLGIPLHKVTHPPMGYSYMVAKGSQQQEGRDPNAQALSMPLVLTHSPQGPLAKASPMAMPS